MQSQLFSLVSEPTVTKKYIQVLFLNISILQYTLDTTVITCFTLHINLYSKYNTSSTPTLKVDRDYICLNKSPGSFPTNEHSALKHLHGFLYLNWKLSPGLRMSSVLISILLQSLVTWILVIILHYLQIFLSFNFFISCYGALSLYLNWIWSVYLS